MKEAAASSYPTPDRGVEFDSAESVRFSGIDASMKWAGLLFVGSAVAWLMAGTVFALIASVKMTTPEFLGSWEWLTFGRVHAVQQNVMVYGWGSNAVFAVGLWIMARLCGTQIRHIGLLTLAGCFWNLALTIGVIGILRGDMLHAEWLEIPTYATPLILLSYLMIAVWGILAFQFRHINHIYVSQLFIIAAFFWFPWFYSAAQVMLFLDPARGTVQSLANWWFAHNLQGLWLTPVAIAAAYYFIPKILGVPIRAYSLAVAGFWTFAFFYSWAGMRHLIGGPVPAWVVSMGIVAGVMMVIPVVIIAINHHLTAAAYLRQVWRSTTLRFVVFGAVNFTLFSVLGWAMSLRSVSEVTQFTHFAAGHTQHGLYAFFTMIMFGSIYYIMPRLLRCGWPSATLIRVHFWSGALGITLMLLALYIGGWIQGVQMNDPANHPNFIGIVQNTLPWLHARSFAVGLLAVGHVALAVHLCWIVGLGLARREPAGGSRPYTIAEDAR